jgi:MFS family permease
MIGIRSTFHVAGAVIFLAFIATVIFIKRDTPAAGSRAGGAASWRAIPDKRPVLTMLVVGMLLMLANMSIEPIITVYVQQLVASSKITFVSGLVMSGAALGSILSAARLGKLADRIGHWTVIAASLSLCAVLLIPQAFVTTGWQLIALRFAMGLALGGLLPCVASVIRHSVPSSVAGTMLGYSTSAQYIGQVTGPLAGGFFGGHFGMRSVFWGTAAVMAAGAALTAVVHARVRGPVNE